MTTPALTRTTTALALAALVAALAACSDSRSAPAPATARPTAVGVQTLAPESVALTTELLGRTRAPLAAEIRPQVGGIVQAQRFTDGQRVQAGQLLYQIDPASYRAAVASAEATVAKAEATVAANRLTAERQAALLKIDATPRQTVQDADAALKQSEADLAAARAALETAKINLARTAVTSPISGLADVSTVTAGALVTADQTTALTTVRQTDVMQVDLPQSSADWLRLKQAIASGQLKAPGGSAPVTLILEDGSTYAHPGKLSVSGVSVNTGTGAITLRAEFPNREGLLLPGMAVRARLATATAEQAILVPQQAVSRNAAGQASVWVVDAQQKAQPRVIVAERSVGNRWLVTQGLQAGERVVVEGNQKVKPGDTVQAQPVALASN
jgi:membrane fusion protein, multidrug efflux system